MILIAILFWLSAGLILFTHFGYTVPLTELSRSMTTNALAGHLLDEAVPTMLIGSGSARSGRAQAEPSGARPEGSTAGPPASPSTGGGATTVPVRHGPGPTTWWVPGMFGTPKGPLPHRRVFVRRPRGRGDGSPARSGRGPGGTAVAARPATTGGRPRPAPCGAGGGAAVRPPQRSVLRRRCAWPAAGCQRAARPRKRRRPRRRR